MRLRGILNHEQVVLTGDFENGIHIGRLAEEMDDHFLTYDEAPLLILDTSAVRAPLGGAAASSELDEAVEAVRRMRGGARCVRLGAR